MAEWTVDTLHAHLEEVLHLRADRTAERFREVEKAVELAREAALREMRVTADALSHRLDTLNELRRTFEAHDKRGASVAQLETVQARLEAEISAIKAHVSEMAKRQDQASGARAGAARMWGLVSGGIGLVAVILSILANLR